jgi:two-component system response regulator YesN
MDGVNFLNALKNFGMMPKVIVISGYSNFEYMHSAIQMMAVDYILKPIGTIQFNECLRNTVIEITKKNTTDVLVTADEIAEKLLTTMNIKSTVENELNSYCILNEFVSKYRILEVFLMRIINFDDICQHSFNGMTDLLFYRIQNILESELKSWKPVFLLHLMNENSEFVGVVGLNDFEDDKFEELKLHLSNVLNKVKSSLGLRCLIGVSEKFFSQKGVLEGYQKAYAALCHSNLLNGCRIYFYSSSCKRKTIGIKSLSSIESRVIGFIKCGDFRNAHQTIDETFDLLELEEQVTMVDLEQLVTHFYSILDKLNLSSKTPIPFSRDHIRMDLYRNIDDISCVRKMFSECIDKTADWYLQNKDVINNNSINELLDFVDSHYNEKIELSTLSSKFFMSREYVSKLFKKKTGENFVDYLTRKRIEEAAIMILNTKLSLSKIAESVGFSEEGYFIKVFKKNMGVTPKCYRVGKMNTKASSEIK